MDFKLVFNDHAKNQFQELEKSKDKHGAFKADCKALAFMETDLHHPSLHTHEYHGIEGPNGEKIFESYAQNHTPGAFRVFWYYGPTKNEITVVSIVPHPQ